MPDYSEKRGFVRMPIDCELSFSPLDDAQTYQGKVVNLSNGGILFTAAQSFDIGTRLEIELTPANSVTPPMQAWVTVTRVDASDSSFEIAGKIDED
jgi:hypothetical protein